MKKLFLLLSLLLSCFLLITGCAKQDNKSAANTHEVTYKGQKYSIPKEPKNIVVLSNSLLMMLHAVEGNAVARVETYEKLPEQLEQLPTVGHTATINMETLLGLKPNLVLGLESQHAKLGDLFKSNNVPFITINYDGIYDNVPLLSLMGEITGHETKAKEVIKNYETKIAKVKESAKKQNPIKVAVLRATGKSVTAETSKAITASMIKELGINNVILNHQNLKEDSKTVPYSLESLATDNPDIIFIVTMGKKEEIDKTLNKEMMGNPAWNQLTAVKNNKVYFLPANWFLLNPGLNTPEAMAELVKLTYGTEVQF